MVDFVLAHITPRTWLAVQALLVAVLLLGAARNLGRLTR